MSGAVILDQAARVVRATFDGVPADQALRAAVPRSPHFAAPGPWRETSRAVFAYFRWRRWLEAGAALPRQIAHALALQQRFDADPGGIEPGVLAARTVPDWTRDELTEVPTAWLQQLQHEPPVWIRVRTGREAAVRDALGHCAPSILPLTIVPPPAITTALRYTGAADLYRTPPFQAGEFEIQDLASQLVGHACAPQPGQTWWDACAGEGGKTLHLSDLMQNRGLIWASDRSARRLTRLRARAARAGVFNYRAAAWEGDARLPTKTRFDGVLIDAPCSGVGTWQRNPHARWTTSPADVRELAAVQVRLLAHAATALKPGGRLIYAVCTLTRAETTAVADAFTAAHPAFAPAPLPLAPPAAPDASRLLLWPHELNANGMFLAAWTRK